MRPGCSSCLSGYKAFLMDKSKNFCINSESIKFERSERINYFTKYCQVYKLKDNEIICDLCRKDKIKTKDHKCIFIGKIHENCLLARDSLACAVCNKGFVIEKEWCVRNGLQNCLAFDENQINVCV